MKRNYNFYTLAAVLLFSAASFAQATIAQWNFNGPSNTTVPGGATSPTPSVGTGSAELVGGTTATFANGNSSAGTLETETTNPPNYGWNVTGFPGAGLEPKTRGAQFNVSTAGQAGITFRYEQRHSNTSSNTYVVQYTADRTASSPVWTDAQTFTFTPTDATGDAWFNDRIVNLSAVTALDNNPNVAFRVVSAFDPIAGDYVASKLGSTYGGGTARMEMVTISSATTLGLPSHNADSNVFTMYPNPSNKEVVTFNQAYDIEVYSVTGKMLYKASNVSSIDTNGFASGIYLVKNQTGAVQKLIVK